jgi:hypothetical protein
MLNTLSASEAMPNAQRPIQNSGEYSPRLAASQNELLIPAHV